MTLFSCPEGVTVSGEDCTESCVLRLPEAKCRAGWAEHNRLQLATVSLTFRVENVEQFLDLLRAEAGDRVVRVGQLLRSRLLPRGHGEHLRRRQARLSRSQMDVG